MNGTTGDLNATATEDQGTLDPEAAAALLQESRREARRQFEFSPPVLAVVRAGVFFVGYGALWLSVHDQHPYTGPTGPALLVLFGAIAVLAVTSASVLGPRVSGVGGRARRDRRIIGVIALVAYTCIFVFEGALRADGFGVGLAYGVWAACGPLIVLGPIVAMHASRHEDWPLLGVGLALGLVATGAAFTGPRLCWGIVGLGCGLAFLAQGLAQFTLRRR